MKRLNSLTLTNVDTSLTELIPALSRVPTLRNLMLCKSIPESISLLGSLPATYRITDYNVIIDFCSNSGVVIECQYRTTELIDQTLSQLPLEFITQVETFIVCGGIEIKCRDKEEKVDNIYEDEDEDVYQYKNENENESDDINQHKDQHKDDIDVDKNVEECQYEDEAIDEDEDDIDEEDEDEEDKDKKRYEFCKPLLMPLCLPDLIPKMERLNMLMLKNVLDSSLTELLPALSRLPTLRNLTLPKLNSANIILLCQWLPISQLEKLSVYDSATHKMTATLCNNSIEVIEYHHCTPEFIHQILSLMPQQLLAQVKTYNELHVIQYDYNDYDDNYYTWLQPLPPCLPKLIPRMERLSTLILKNVLEDSLKELIPSLSRVPTLRNLTLSILDSQGVIHLCQWLLICQLETLKLPSLSPDHINMVSRALSTVSSLKALDMQVNSTTWSQFIFRGMQAFISMLQQSQSLIEVSITKCRIDSDSACCLAEALHNNTTLRKLRLNQVGERGVLAMAEMLKYNNTLEKLDLSRMYYSKVGNKDFMIKTLVDSLTINKQLGKLILPCRFKSFVSLYDVHKERIHFA